MGTIAAASIATAGPVTARSAVGAILAKVLRIQTSPAGFWQIFAKQGIGLEDE